MQIYILHYLSFHLWKLLIKKPENIMFQIEIISFQLLISAKILVLDSFPIEHLTM